VLLKVIFAELAPSAVKEMVALELLLSWIRAAISSSSEQAVKRVIRSIPIR
jgi:hypothetical protein